MKIEITKENLEAVYQAASNDRTRYNLMGLLFSAKNKEVVATNGRIMTTCPFDGDLDKDYLISSRSIKQVLAVWKTLDRFVKKFPLTFDFSSESLSCLGIDLEILEAVFPDYDRIKITKPINHEIKLAVDVLDSILKQAKKAKNKAVVLSFHDLESKSPISYSTENFKGVAAPMRLDK